MNQIYVAFMDWRTASFNPKWGILCCSFPNTRQELSDRCRKCLTEKYGENPPEQIKARLEHELWCLTGRPWSDSAYFLLLARLAEKCISIDAPHTIGDRGGTSFAAYLLGITETNPLPPHKYCPDCGFVEFVDETKYESGFDLWSEPHAFGACPRCGAKLTSDGHNLDSTHLFDDDGGLQSYFEIYVPVESQFVLFDFLEELGELKTGLTREEAEEVEHNCVHNRIPNNRIQILGSCVLSQIKELEKTTGIRSRSIQLPEIDLPAFFSNENYIGFPYDEATFRLLAERIHPVCFSDLVRASGYTHGTGVWEGNAEQLISSGIRPIDTIAHRDDILQTLMRFGADRKTSLKMMHVTRRGIINRVLTPELAALLQDKGVPDWYISSMQKILYLYPKAHTIEWWIQYLRLIWYKCNYPDEFAASTSEILDGGN